MPTAFNFINSANANSGAVSSLQFASIPNTYEHLYLVVNARTTRNVGGTDNIGIRFNGVTTNDYYFKYYTGSGTAYEGGSSGGGTSSAFLGFCPQATSSDNWEANTFATMTVLIPIYTTTGPKSYQSEYSADNNTAYSQLGFAGGVYTPTSPISQINIISRGGFDIAQYSTAYLYGIS